MTIPKGDLKVMPPEYVDTASLPARVLQAPDRSDLQMTYGLKIPLRSGSAGNAASGE
jgi:hypothetical protein